MKNQVQDFVRGPHNPGAVKFELNLIVKLPCLIHWKTQECHFTYTQASSEWAEVFLWSSLSTAASHDLRYSALLHQSMPWERSIEHHGVCELPGELQVSTLTHWAEDNWQSRWRSAFWFLCNLGDWLLSLDTCLGLSEIVSLYTYMFCF